VTSPFPDPAARIIEVAPPDAATFDHFRSAGCTRYLGLTTDVVAVAGGTDDRPFAPLGSPGVVRANNADVLILHDRYARYLWYRQLGWAQFVAVPADGPSAAEARLASRVHRRERLDEVTWGGRRFDVVRMNHFGQVAARHYLSPLASLAALPDILEERGIRYVVLRWFDALPDVEPGEDLDVLVADDDLEALRDVLDTRPGVVPIDVYSTTGRPGADFQAMAYYPPRLANGILERAVRLPSGYRAPSPEDHFLSLSYHALYHKGPGAGLPSVTTPPGDDPEHDYLAILSRLAVEDGMAGALTMEGLDDHLATRGWRPPRDMLAKLSQHNRWVSDRFFGESTAGPEPPLITAFLLRDRAADAVAVATAKEVITQHGFEVVHEHTLDDAARERCAREIRGGNWGQGPFATSGGDPAVLLVALHDHPEPPDPAVHRQHPGLANAHTLRAKLDVRDRILAGIPDAEQFNPMHSSDSDDDGWHYVELADPDALAGLRLLVDERRANRVVGAGPDATGGASLSVATANARRAARATTGKLRRAARHNAERLLRWGVDRRVTG
jgi:hypothetical protein